MATHPDQGVILRNLISPLSSDPPTQDRHFLATLGPTVLPFSFIDEIVAPHTALAQEPIA